MKIPYFCCIGAELKRYAKDFDFMNQVYLYKIPADDSIEEVLAEDYFKAISDSVLQDDLVYIYEASEDTLHSCKFDKQNGHITAVPLASDETLTGAVTTIIHDNLTKNRAVISNNDGKVAVSEVTSTELGYLHGATSNIQEQLNEKAKTDLSNLTSAGKNIANWSSNVTNCITEIPQDIKLELNNGTLTLKAGSKVYVPNGAGVFDVVTIASDITYTYGLGAYTLGLYYRKNNNILAAWSKGAETSGGSAPSGDGTFYNTTTNKISRYVGGSIQVDNLSFPIATITTNASQITSIDQVFNGFGYIGSCVFTLPGVKGLYPNGRNQDGTLKSGNINCTDVQVSSQFNDTLNHVLMINPNGRCALFDTSSFSYNPDTNIMYNSLGVVLSSAVLGTFTTTSGVISNFRPNTVFRSVDYSDTDYIARQGVPNVAGAVNLTLGSSGSTIIAPGDGYITLTMEASQTYSSITLNNSSALRSIVVTPNVGVYIGTTIPCAKGDTVSYNYTSGDTLVYFKFVPLKGSK